MSHMKGQNKTSGKKNLLYALVIRMLNEFMGRVDEHKKRHENH